MADRRADLRELLDRVADLAVEDAAVGDDDDESKTRLAVVLQRRSAGARARRSSSTCRCRPSAGSGSAARPRARARRRAGGGRRRAGGSAARSASTRFLPGLLVLALDDLRVVLEDVGEARRRQDLLPEVVGLEPVRVRRVAGAVVPARLNGRNHDALPFSCVQKRTSPSSTAKCATQRPSSNSFSRGSRSRLYCSTASSTVCLVRLFFSSNVATGRPLTKRQRSSASCVSSPL